MVSLESSGFSVSTFSNSVRAYELERNGLHADSIMRQLNDLIDVKDIINSGEKEQKLFVFSLSKILTLVDSHSELAWSTLDILEVICNATGNENILSHLRKLTSLVSQLLFLAVKEDKKVRVLRVLQTLTYGIEIPRPDSFVAPLIAALVNGSKKGNPNSVSQLSLSVLANMLHRNKVALCALMQTVNLKDFMNELLRIQTDIFCKMEVCKLMFLLEDLIYEKPDEEEVLNFIKVSFCTVIESGSSGNRSHLQHCILFFDDKVNSKKININTLDKPWFLDSVSTVLALLDTDVDKVNLECAMLLFKFLRIFVRMEVPSVATLQPAIMKQGVAWVSKYRSKATEAVLTMHSILASHLKYPFCVESSGMTGEELKMVFLSLLQETAISSSDHAFLTALFDFLSGTLDVEIYKCVLKEHLKKEAIESFFESLPSNIQVWNNISSSESTMKMYIHLLYLVFKVVNCCDSSWMKLYSCLFSEQKVISALAVALMHGSSDLKGKVLSLVSSVGFPVESMALLANCMADCGSERRLRIPASEENTNEHFSYLSSNIASFYTEANNLVRNVKHSLKEGKDVCTTQVLQLYEYKEQVHSDYQQALISSLTCATKEKSLLLEEVYLTNQIASEFRQELYLLRPAFNQMRDKYDDALKLIRQKADEMSHLKKRMDEEITSCQKTIQTLKENVERLEKQNQNSTEQMQCLKEQLTVKAEQSAFYELEIKDLQNKGDALREQIEEKDKIHAENANLSKEIERIGSELKSKSKQVVLLEQEKIIKDREIQELQRIRDTVFQLTGGKKF